MADDNKASGFTLDLQLRDGGPVLILNGTELEPERAERLQRELGIMVKAAGMLAGRDGRLRGAGREAGTRQPKPVRAERSKPIEVVGESAAD